MPNDVIFILCLYFHFYFPSVLAVVAATEHLLCVCVCVLLPTDAFLLTFIIIIIYGIALCASV